MAQSEALTLIAGDACSFNCELLTVVTQCMRLEPAPGHGSRLCLNAHIRGPCATGLPAIRLAIMMCCVQSATFLTCKPCTKMILAASTNITSMGVPKSQCVIGHAHLPTTYNTHSSSKIDGHEQHKKDECDKMDQGCSKTLWCAASKC